MRVAYAIEINPCNISLLKGEKNVYTGRQMDKSKIPLPNFIFGGINNRLLRGGI